jgi:hypothetical protein
MAMNDKAGNKVTEKKSYRVLLILVIGVAAFSSAMNELNQLRRFTLQASNLIAAWTDIMVPTACASGRVVVTSRAASIVPTVPQTSSHSDEFRWNGNIAPGLAIEVKGINGEINAEPTSGSEVQVVASKRSKRSDVNSVQIKVQQHAGGVTICALYPNDEGKYPTDCMGENSSKDNNEGSGSENGSARNNDVRVDFTVRVPDRVGFVAKTINGGISATSLTGNVVTKTINGSIKISTSGYAEASTINGEIVARINDANWPKSLTFKTLNGEINLDLPRSVNASVDAQTLNGTINSDFPLEVTNQKGKKFVRGTIGSGGRELFLKTLNGSINLRIAG